MKTIGVIGVGMMGSGIAANLLKHGHALVLLAHPGNQPLDPLVAAGASVLARASDLAASVDIVLLCVTGTPQVEDAIFRADGVLAGLRPGSIVIDCSTAIPSSTLRIAEAIERAGGRFMDAAMTRTPKEAAEGRLNLIVGAEASLFNECRPILACFAENIVHAGPVSAGHRLKLIHNYVSLGYSVILAEAAACATKAGIDPSVLTEVLAKGGGGGVVLDRLRPYIERGDTTPFRFSVSNAHKDLGYYEAMARETGAATDAAHAVLAVYANALAIKPDAVVPELVTLLG